MKDNAKYGYAAWNGGRMISFAEKHLILAAVEHAKRDRHCAAMIGILPCRMATKRGSRFCRHHPEPQSIPPEVAAQLEEVAKKFAVGLPIAHSPEVLGARVTF